MSVTAATAKVSLRIVGFRSSRVARTLVVSLMNSSFKANLTSRDFPVAGMVVSVIDHEMVSSSSTMP